MKTFGKKAKDDAQTVSVKQRISDAKAERAQADANAQPATEPQSADDAATPRAATVDCHSK